MTKLTCCVHKRMFKFLNLILYSLCSPLPQQPDSPILSLTTSHTPPHSQHKSEAICSTRHFQDMLHTPHLRPAAHSTLHSLPPSYLWASHAEGKQRNFLVQMHFVYCTKTDCSQFNSKHTKKWCINAKEKSQEDGKTEFYQKSALRGWWYLSSKFSCDLCAGQSSRDFVCLKAFITWHCSHVLM